MKKCPYCTEEIPDDLTVCMYCEKTLPVFQKQIKNLPTDTSPNTRELAQTRLKELNKLRNDGVITENEYNEQASQIVVQMPPSSNSSAGIYFVMFIILTAIFLGISIVAKWEIVCVGPLFIVYVAFVGGLVSAYNKQNKDDEQAVVQANALREAKEQYNKIRKQVSIPETAKEITYFKSSAKSLIKLANTKNKVYIWKSKGNLSFFPCSPSDIYSISIANLKINTIGVSQVEYFSKSGEIFRENKISGGGGGGSSIGGAVAGGLIAGDTGAIIGSRKKVNQIKSELITHDTRETFLNYFDGNERHTLFFDNNAFQTFNDLIPEKEFSIVSAIKSSEIIKNQVNVNSQSSVTDQLRELAKLRDDGIITENEFNEKKKQLLDKIS